MPPLKQSCGYVLENISLNFTSQAVPGMLACHHVLAIVIRVSEILYFIVNVTTQFDIADSNVVSIVIIASYLLIMGHVAS